MIPLFAPRVSEDDIAAVGHTLRSGWLSEGQIVKDFEAEFARAVGAPRALALNSGTAALHLALIAAGVGPGDEVITTAQSFVATALAPLYVGARVVFADLEPRSPNLAVADVARRIGPKTKAILAVHYGGLPCDIDALARLAEANGLALIEDAAHAIGAYAGAAHVGTIGDFGVFSFQAIKQITTGDGGMLLCKSEEQHQRAYRARWFGIDRARRVPNALGSADWDIRELGFKYHMNDLAATLGRSQLAAYPPRLERKRQIVARYRAGLRDLAGLELLDCPVGRTESCWLFTLLVERRLEFVRALHDRGVGAGVWHTRIDRNSLFGGLRTDLPNQEHFDAHQVAIPARDSLTDDEIEQILAAVRAGW